MNAKARRKALCMVLTERVNNKRFVVIDKFDLAQPKTKEFAEILDKLPVADNTVLLIITGSQAEKNLPLAARNLTGVGIIRADSLNIKELLAYDYILLSRDSIDIIVKTFSGSKGSVSKKVTKKASAAKKKSAAVKVKPIKKNPTKK